MESSKPPSIWIVKGIVTDPSSYSHTPHRPDRGDPEYRVYDGDPRPLSRRTGYLIGRFLSLEDVLVAHPGAIFHLLEQPSPEVHLYQLWEDYVSTRRGRANAFPETMQEICDAAYEQGILATLLDALEERR